MKKYIAPTVRYAKIYTGGLMAQSIDLGKSEETIGSSNEILTREEQDTWGIEW